MDNQTLAGLLAATPPADLKIIELTAELTRPDGTLDLDAAADRQAEVELACVQAQDYASATKRLLGAMQLEAAAPPLLSGLAATAPAASAVAAGTGHSGGIRRTTTPGSPLWSAASFPRRSRMCWQPRTCWAGWKNLPGSSRNATFPLYAPFLEFWLDEGEEPPWTWLRRGIPFDLMGFGYDDLHEMWDGYREGLSALALLAQPPDSFFMGPDGIRTAWLESATERIPQETLLRIPQGGIATGGPDRSGTGNGVTRGRPRPPPGSGARPATSFSTTTTADGDYEGFSDPWEEEIIQEGHPGVAARPAP